MVEASIAAITAAVFAHSLDEPPPADALHRLRHDPEHLAFRVALGQALAALTEAHP